MKFRAFIFAVSVFCAVYSMFSAVHAAAWTCGCLWTCNNSAGYTLCATPTNGSIAACDTTPCRTDCGTAQCNAATDGSGNCYIPGGTTFSDNAGTIVTPSSNIPLGT